MKIKGYSGNLEVKLQDTKAHATCHIHEAGGRGFWVSNLDIPEMIKCLSADHRYHMSDRDQIRSIHNDNAVTLQGISGSSRITCVLPLNELPRAISALENAR